MVRFSITITGRVQGVGYRWFVRNNARDLGLVGFVRNLQDGTVEVIAEGEEKNLKELVERCKEGPMRSHVEEVAYKTEPQNDGQEVFKTFDIRK